MEGQDGQPRTPNLMPNPNSWEGLIFPACIPRPSLSSIPKKSSLGPQPREGHLQNMSVYTQNCSQALASAPGSPAAHPLSAHQGVSPRTPRLARTLGP